MPETRTNRRGATVERATVKGRRTIVYDDPDRGKPVHAGPGETVWIPPDEIATLRARGFVVDENDPGFVDPHTINGPSITFVDEAELGLVRQVTR